MRLKKPNGEWGCVVDCAFSTCSSILRAFNLHLATCASGFEVVFASIAALQIAKKTSCWLLDLCMQSVPSNQSFATVCFCFVEVQILGCTENVCV